MPIRRTKYSMLVLLFVGCATAPPACDRDCVSANLVARFGHDAGPAHRDPVLPYGATFADGLTEEEAVVIALWNNALFQELLADLGVARGDLIQAGLLPNPEVLYFFQVPDKPFKYAFEFPIESLWLRPVRIAAAGRESERVCSRLTQSGLDLIRDARVAFADVLLAQGRLRVARENVQVRGDVAKIAEKRFEAGDIAKQEAATARIDALIADQDLARIAYDVALAEERLRLVMGTGGDRSELRLVANEPPPLPALDVEALTAEAVATRPDAIAAAQNAEAAAERLRLAKLNWVRFLGLGDATSGRRNGHEFGPAFRVTLPIFNRNQGNIARAEAEFERADRQRLTAHNQIINDVHVAFARYAQARAELKILDGEVQPEAEKSIRRAEVGYREGDTNYVVILLATRQLIDTRLRREVLIAEVRRTIAELERSTGRRFAAPGATP